MAVFAVPVDAFFLEVKQGFKYAGGIGYVLSVVARAALIAVARTGVRFTQTESGEALRDKSIVLVLVVVAIVVTVGIGVSGEGFDGFAASELDGVVRDVEAELLLSHVEPFIVETFISVVSLLVVLLVVPILKVTRNWASNGLDSFVEMRLALQFTRTKLGSGLDRFRGSTMQVLGVCVNAAGSNSEEGNKTTRKHGRCR